MDFGRRLKRARRIVETARASFQLYRSTELVHAFGPLDAAQFARDFAHTRRRAGLAVIHAHAIADPHRPAIVSGSLRLSYAELDARVNQLTHALGTLGVQPRDRVGLFLKNGHEYLELQIALSAIGAVGVQIGYRLKAEEVAYILGNSQAKALFFHHELAPVVDETLALGKSPEGVPIAVTRASSIATRPLPGFLDYEAALARERADAPRQVGPGAGRGGIMIYTSGTTGRGKGARRDFGRMGFGPVLGMLTQLPLRRDDRHLVVCPLYHSLAAFFVVPVIVIGGCVVIHEHFDAEEALRTIERERITSSLMVPTMLQRLLALPPETLFKYDTSSLRWIMSGAAPLPAEVARRAEDAFGPILYNLYGATETGLVTLALPGEHTARPGTIGRAIAGNTIRLLDEQGHDVVDGEVGELYVRNGMMMDAYHGNDAATQAAMRDGFLSVGDLARRDRDGYYYLVDRKTDMVISGGVNIYPWEIEQRLHEHPDVHEAAVLGVPDAEWGESLVAWVVPREGQHPTAEGLAEFVRAALADYKRPRRVFFVESLPRNPTGKVLKRELRARYLAEQRGPA
jgi:fatty-acyl-CoA synthase